MRIPIDLRAKTPWDNDPDGEFVVDAVMRWVIDAWRGVRHVAPESPILALAKTVEPVTAVLAELAGKALRATGGSNAIDAIVMASAAQRGDIVYTSDVDDLLGFSDVFPDVRVLGVDGP